MKTLLFVFLLIPSCGLFSQAINIPESIDLSEGKTELNETERNGFKIAVGGEKKEIIKSFTKFLKDEHKYDVKSKSKTVVGEDLLIPGFSDKHFNLHAFVKESGGSCNLWYFISFGTDIYVNSTDYPAESEKCKAILKSFVKHYYSEFINADIEENTKILTKSTKELSSVTSTISKIEKSKSKEAKKKKKLEKGKVKLAEKSRKIQEEIEKNTKLIEERSTELNRLSEELNQKTTEQDKLQTKINEEKKILEELKLKLTKVQQL